MESSLPVAGFSGVNIWCPGQEREKTESPATQYPELFTSSADIFGNLVSGIRAYVMTGQKKKRIDWVFS